MNIRNSAGFWVKWLKQKIVPIKGQLNPKTQFFLGESHCNCQSAKNRSVEFQNSICTGCQLNSEI